MNRIFALVDDRLFSLEQTANAATGSHLQSLAVERHVWGPIQRLSWVICDPFKRGAK